MKFKKILMLAFIFPAFVSANFVAQTIRKVEIFGPAIGNASNNEVAVVNNTGLVYIAGQAFGSNIGIIDPNTNMLIKVIQRDANNPVNIFFSGVNQASNIVYFLKPTSPTSSLLPIDGRAASPTFNETLPLISFPNQTIATFDH